MIAKSTGPGAAVAKYPAAKVAEQSTTLNKDLGKAHHAGERQTGRHRRGAMAMPGLLLVFLHLGAITLASLFVIEGRMKAGSLIAHR